MQEEMKSPQASWRLRQGVLQAVALTVLGMLLGTIVHAARPSSLPWLGSWVAKSVASRHLSGLSEISLDEAAALYRAARALFLDARDPGAFQAGHLPGAFNVPPEEAAFYSEEIKAMAEAGMVPIAYCDGLDCPLSAELAQALQERGIPSVRVLVNGWSRWRQAGYLMEGG